MEFNFDESSDSDECEVVQSINIYIEQRNGKKSWTKIHGLDTIVDIDFKAHLKTIKKKLCCNGSINTDDDKQVLILQGDHRSVYKQFLIDKFKLHSQNIIVHGF